MCVLYFVFVSCILFYIWNGRRARADKLKDIIYSEIFINLITLLQERHIEINSSDLKLVFP